MELESQIKLQTGSPVLRIISSIHMAQPNLSHSGLFNFVFAAHLLSFSLSEDLLRVSGFISLKTFSVRIELAQMNIRNWSVMGQNFIH